jgi:hypothetical protein
MTALILKSATHMYKIFKVYLVLAVCGALGVVVVQALRAKPLVLLVALGSIAFLVAAMLSGVQGHKFIFGPNSKKRRRIPH